MNLKRQSSTNRADAILLAAGRGSRFDSRLKQFSNLNGKPVFIFALETILKLPFVERVVVVVPEHMIRRTEKIVSTRIREHNRVICIAGGRDRRESTRRAIEYLSLHAPPVHVLIHDAARPMLRADSAVAVYKAALQTGAAAMGRPTTNISGKVRAKKIKELLDRTSVYETYTPHCFSFALLKKAHEIDPRKKTIEGENIALVLACGKPVALVGQKTIDIKLTFREDLYLLKRLLKR